MEGAYSAKFSLSYLSLEPDLAAWERHLNVLRLSL